MLSRIQRAAGQPLGPGEGSAGAGRRRDPSRVVLLDRDGTIIIERDHLTESEQVELLAGAAQGLRRLQDLGLRLVVLTNQSVVGRRLIDQRRLDEIHGRMVQMLAEEGVALKWIYYCPHTPREHCQCRKPETGLVYEALHDLSFDPRLSFVVGDKASDIELGRRVGATTLLVRSGYGAQVMAKRRAKPDYVVDDICEAAAVIASILT